jgi:hypothetical protein
LALGARHKRSGKNDAKIRAFPRHVTFIKPPLGFPFKSARFTKF